MRLFPRLARMLCEGKCVRSSVLKETLVWSGASRSGLQAQMKQIGGLWTQNLILLHLFSHEQSRITIGIAQNN
jgi:hypothetical protein